MFRLVRPRRPWLPLALAAVLLVPRAADAAWSSTGNPLADSDDNDELIAGVGLQPGVTVCPDAGGGVISAYVINDQSIRINRLDEATGSKLWGPTGSDVTGPGRIADGSPIVLSDLNGGAWVVWQDNRVGAPGVYVQRFDDAGARVFSAGGIRVVSSITGFSIDVTATGELLMAFGLDDVRFQRVSLGGVLELGATGVQVSTNDPTSLRITHDGADGAFIAWTDFLPIGTPSWTGLFANRVNAIGARQWGVAGVTLRHATGVNVQRIADGTDGINYFLSWEENDGVIDVNGEALPIRAQKLNGAGARQWAVDGVVAFTPLNTAFDEPTVTAFQRLAVDSEGSLVIGWLDGRDFNRPAPNGFLHRQDIYAQKLASADGARLWPVNGAVVDSQPGTQNALVVLSAAAPGAIFFYEDFLFGNGGDPHAKRLDGNAASLWSRFLSPTVLDGPASDRPCAAPDGAGGLVAAWQDERDDPPNGVDVYATHRRGSDGQVVAPSVTVLGPNGGESLHGFEPITVNWNSANMGSTQVQVQFTVDGGAPVLAVGAEANPTGNDGSFVWHVPDVASSNVRVVVSAVGFVATDQSNAPFSICRSLAAGTTRAAFGQPTQVATGDFDEDGILDLAVAHLGGLHVVYGGGAAGVGDGTFPTDLTLESPTNVLGVTTADFNEDGHLDLAYSRGGVLVRFGDGSGGFGPATVYAAGVFRKTVVTADLDTDGIQDLVCGATGGAEPMLILLRGNGTDGVGDGTFATPVLLPGAWNTSDIVVADFNEDDAPDVALIAHETPSSRRFVVYLGGKSDGLPTGIFGAPTSIVLPTLDASRMALGDFDENGILDVAVANASELRIMVGQGVGSTGNGTFVAGTPIPLTNGTDVVAGDLDDDGHADLMVGTSTGSFGTFYGPMPFVAGGRPASPIGRFVVAGDFVEDSRMDLVGISNTDLQVYAGGCASTLSTTITTVQPLAGSAVVRGMASYHDLRWNKGAGVLAVDVELSRDGGTSWEKVARNQTSTVYRWRGAGPDSPNCRMRVSDATVHNRTGTVDFAICSAFASALSMTMPAKMTDVAVGDFNEDGHADLAMSGVDDLHVRLSDGAGGYAPTLTLPTTQQGNGIVVGDFDDDGILDMMATGTNGLMFARGLGAGGIGNGTFAGVVNNSLGKRTTDIVAAQMNEDGILDLIVVHPNHDLITVLLGNGAGGNGDGTFAATTYATGDQPTGLAVSDLNRDGRLDVAVTNLGAGTVSVFLGLGAGGAGNGQLGAAVAYASGPSPTAIVHGEFNHDDFPDLLVSNDATPATLSWLRGQGTPAGPNGTFDAPQSTPTLADPVAIVLTDLNDDGRSDPIVLSESRDSLAAYATLGFFAPGFTLFDKRPTGDTPSAGVAADLDGDRVPDLAVTNVFSNGLQVLFGPCPSSARPTVSLVDPDGGESFEVADETLLRWSNFDYRGPVDFEVSFDDGVNWEPVVRGVSRAFDFFTTASASWSVPPPATVNALIRVCESHATTRCDTSAAVFAIGSPLVGVVPDGVPAIAELSLPWPNPSRVSVSMVLGLPGAGRARVEVFDLAGRRVRTLLDGERAAGRHAIVWDGRDDDGHAVAGGLFLVRARGVGLDVSRRVIRTR